MHGGGLGNDRARLSFSQISLSQSAGLNIGIDLVPFDPHCEPYQRYEAPWEE